MANSLVIETLLHVYDCPVFRMAVVNQFGLVEPLTNATEMVFLFEKPDGTVEERDAEWVTDGSDGLMQYETLATDIDQAGIWLVQGKVVLPEGKYYSKEKLRFRVLTYLGGS